MSSNRITPNDQSINASTTTVTDQAEIKECPEEPIPAKDPPRFAEDHSQSGSVDFNVQPTIDFSTDSVLRTSLYEKTNAPFLEILGLDPNPKFVTLGLSGSIRFSLFVDNNKVNDAGQYNIIPTRLEVLQPGQFGASANFKYNTQSFEQLIGRNKMVGSGLSLGYMFPNLLTILKLEAAEGNLQVDFSRKIDDFGTLSLGVGAHIYNLNIFQDSSESILEESSGYVLNFGVQSLDERFSFNIDGTVPSFRVSEWSSGYTDEIEGNSSLTGAFSFYNETNNAKCRKITYSVGVSVGLSDMTGEDIVASEGKKGENDISFNLTEPPQRIISFDGSVGRAITGDKNPMILSLTGDYTRTRTQDFEYFEDFSPLNPVVYESTMLSTNALRLGLDLSVPLNESKGGDSEFDRFLDRGSGNSSLSIGLYYKRIHSETTIDQQMSLSGGDKSRDSESKDDEIGVSAKFKY